MTIEEGFVEYLAGAGAGAVYHHGGALLDHLIGTHRLLESWGCPPHVRAAGMFHSFYGWLAEPTERSRTALAAAIGKDAEELVFLFASTVPDELLEPERPAAGDGVLLRSGAETVAVAAGTYLGLLRLDLANAEDILERVYLTPAQRQRLSARCARVRETLTALERSSEAPPRGRHD